MASHPEFADCISSPLGVATLLLIPFAIIGAATLSSWLLRRLTRKPEGIWPADWPDDL